MMARKQATKKPVPLAKMKDVVAWAIQFERLTSDPLDEETYAAGGKDVEEYSARCEGLIAGIGELSRTTKTLRERLARAEAETLRAVCEDFVDLFRSRRTIPNAGLELLRAVRRIDVALARLIIMTR
jgi:hypothetical protein